MTPAPRDRCQPRPLTDSPRQTLFFWRILALRLAARLPFLGAGQGNNPHAEESARVGRRGPGAINGPACAAHRGLAVLLTAAVLWPPATPAHAADDPPPDPPHWSDSLKNIPAGPIRLDIGGSLRYRFERQDDFNIQRYADDRDGFSSDGFLLQRARLDFTLRWGQDAQTYLEIQDAMAYDSDFGRGDFDWRLHSCPYWNQLDLRQAYLEWRRIGGTPFGVKAGRQAISYADFRIWGPGEWGNVGRYTWDAVKIIADTDWAEIDAILGHRVRYHPTHFDKSNRRLAAYGLYGRIKRLPLRVDPFWLWKKTRPDLMLNAAGDRLELDTHTVGLHVDGRFGDAREWDYGGTLAHTQGDRSVLRAASAGGRTTWTEIDQDVAAWGGHARLGRTFAHPWKPRVGLEYSYGSGGINDPGDQYETFDGAFGGIDTTKYGWMNFFSWMNLQDYQITLSAKPLSRTQVALEYHFFFLAESRDAWYWSGGRGARRDPTGQSGSSVGQELNLVLTYDLSQRTKLMIGYAHFFPGRFLKSTGDSPDADWLFAQIQYSF